VGDESVMTTEQTQIQQTQQPQQQQAVVQPYHIRIEVNSKQIPSVTISVYGDKSDTVYEEAIGLYRKVKESLAH
jgi:hypothetical protein